MTDQTMWSPTHMVGHPPTGSLPDVVIPPRGHQPTWSPTHGVTDLQVMRSPVHMITPSHHQPPTRPPTHWVRNSHGNPPCSQQLKRFTHPHAHPPTRSPTHTSPAHVTLTPWGHLPTQSPSCDITRPDSGLHSGRRFRCPTETQVQTVGTHRGVG